jgi:hypothetical protein
MPKRTHILRVLTGLAVGSLVSCIDGREEIWLNTDGSGQADLNYSMPAIAARLQGGEEGIRQLIDRFLKDRPEIALSLCDVTTEAERLKIHVRASFDSAMDLKRLSDKKSLEKLPSPVTHLIGDLRLDVRGLNVDFARSIAPGQALPGSLFMPASQFQNRSLTYIMHLPMAATESNATRLENAGRTLIWDFPLGQVLERPVTTSFKARIPIPRWFAVTTTLVALSTAVLVFFKLRKWHRRQRFNQAG